MTASQAQRFFTESQTEAKISSSSRRPAWASCSLLGFLADVVHHRIDCHAADQLAFRIDHRRRDEVVALEGLGGLFGQVVGFELDEIGLHQRTDFDIDLIDQQNVERQHALEVFVAIDDEKLVGMIGKFVETAQITQHDFERHILAHGNHVEVHDRTDRLLRIGHRGAQLLALLDRQTPEDVIDNTLRQVGREVGQFVGIERFGGCNQFGPAPSSRSGLANGIRHFEQDFALELRP